MRKPSKGPWKSTHNEYALLIGDQSWVVVTAPKRGEIGRFKREADAALAACAPELLEALEVCVSQIRALCSADDVPDQAIAAIAKARGEQ